MTTNVPPPPQPVPEQRVAAQGGRRARVSPKMIFFVVIAAIALWFIFANTRNVNVTLWVTTVRAPMWLVLLCTLAVGMLLGLLLAWRRRRR